ncbi:hypothetical protein EMIT0P258_50003 [Pseudomonas sp. IT-P258]
MIRLVRTHFHLYKILDKHSLNKHSSGRSLQRSLMYNTNNSTPFEGYFSIESNIDSCISTTYTI